MLVTFLAAFGLTRINKIVEKLSFTKNPEHNESMNLLTRGKRRTLTSQTLKVMKLTFIFMLACFLQISAKGVSQNITISGKEIPMKQVFKEIKKQSDYVVFFNYDLLKDAHPVTINVKDAGINEVLTQCFKGQPLTYTIENKTIVIVRKPVVIKPSATPVAPEMQLPPTIDVQGWVVDEKGKPVVGASVTVKGTKMGTATDEQGFFRLKGVDENAILIVSGVNIEDAEVKVNGRENLQSIVTKAKTGMSDEVVVTGFFTKKKTSYTGSAISFTGEDLKAISPTNLLEALSTMSPGLVEVQENAAGSNPNRIPQLLIRGVTSFSGNNQSVNQPLIVRDGTIISVQDLYDMDINEIETVTILKDASAAALYGARAANGVIVIERKKIKSGQMKVAFNSVSSIQFPDFSDYKILNATNKLEYERLAGLYTSENNIEQYYLDSLYNEKLKEVNRGVNTDWMSQPARVGYSLDNSIRVFGGSQSTRYELSARYGTVEGVMKGDFRKRYGLGFLLEYYAPHGLSFSNRTTFNQVDTKNSPYGNFEKYTLMNPYDRMYDAQGNLIKTLSWDHPNPLYEAQLGSFYKVGTQAISNDFDARWNINREFRLTTHFNFTLNNGGSENYLSPLSNTYKDVTDPASKGAMTVMDNKGLTYSGNVVLSYNKRLPNSSLFTVNAGGNLNHANLKNYSLTGIGFYSDDLRSINFAAQYPSGSKPIGNQDLSADVAGFANVNYIYNNRYFFDGVYQVSGSSKFGANNRYGQFWSGGIGWNLHNEKFLESEWLDILKLRGSVGYTGKVNFASYQALTTYIYYKDLGYLNGTGAIPITIGNPDLKWERTLNYNIGVDVSLWKRRFNLTADVYLRKTTDLLIDKTFPPSTGTMTGKANLGEMENKGIEIRMDGFVIQNKNVLWQLGANVAHNKNKILKISEALKKQNDLNNDLETIAPLPQYEEGESTTALKVVRSLGIDPATGQEVYLKLNGERTFTYDPNDKVVVGDQLPVASGNFFSIVTYKRITAAAYFGFRYGGYVYNVTRATKIEGSDPRYNADQRVFDDRWKKPGDIAYYKNIADMTTPFHSTRFVEKDNTLSLSRLNFSYEFNPEIFRSLSISKFAVGVSMNDLFRISTINMERGTDYLFSRGFDINLNIMF